MSEHEGSLPKPLAQGWEVITSAGQRLASTLGSNRAMENIVSVEEERLLAAAEAEAAIDTLRGDNIVDPKLIELHLNTMPNDRTKMDFLMEHAPYGEGTPVIEPGKQPPNWDLAAIMQHAEEDLGFTLGSPPQQK